MCIHHSEWTYRGEALAKLKNEAENHYDEIIEIRDPKTTDQKNKCLEMKKGAVERFESKAKQLSLMYDFCFTYFHSIVFMEQLKRISNVSYQM